ncbi:MAG: hypothetical protein ACRDSH_06240 [Pseudonocardiaceae bacterium]
MIDHTTTNEMGTGAARLRLPLQAAPINRTPTSATLADGSGIEASGFWDTLGSIATKALPIVAGALL